MMMMNTMNKNNKKPLSESTEWQLIGHYAKAKERIAALEAENDRLRKAGDAMHDAATNTFQPHPLRLGMEAWLSAKEGQS